MGPLVLVVDDEPSMRTVLSGLLGQEGISCATAGDATEALEVLHRHEVAVVLSDLRMPGMDGLALLDRVREIDPGTEVILLTAYGTEEVAREALRRNAADYIRKPFDRDELLFSVRKALARREATLREVVPADEAAMIGRSAKMDAVTRLIGKVAPTNSTVLIRGESGTGKELVAQAIHAQSPRRDRPFIKVVCAALPETRLAPEAMERLAAHAWPGNVRELQNVLERLVILSSGAVITAEEVAASLPSAPASAAGLPDVRAEAEKQAILKALQESDGKRSQAAKSLGICRRTLHNKLREYKIE